MKRFTALVVFGVMVFIEGRVCAQNLVPNGSFEEVTSCPQNWSKIYNCVGWFTESWSPDCLATCTNFSGISVPDNLFGHQFPFEGENYAGQCAYNTYAAQNRENFGIKLTDSLIIGNTYHFSMRVSRAYGWLSILACNHLGAKFSTAMHTDTPFSFDNLQQLYIDSIITDTNNWVLLHWNYISDSAYKYVYIGNFFDDDHTDTLSAGQIGNAYYYIDSINLFCIGLCQCPIPVKIAASDSAICEGDSLMLSVSGCYGLSTSLLWSTGETTSSIFVSSSGIYSVTRTDTTGNSSSDTISISSPVPEINIISLPVITLCPGDDAVLSTNYFSCGEPSFLWSTGEITSDIQIDTSGVYTVTITDPYGNTSTASTSVTIIQDQPAVPFISLVNDSILFSSSPINNQWFFDSVPIPGATDQSYVPQQSGFYQVEIADSYGCTALSPPYNFIAVGAQNISFESYFVIYPNPVQSQLTINLTKPVNEVTIRVYDLHGRMIASLPITFTKTQAQLNTTTLPDGFYTLQIINNKTGENEVTKFVKEQ